MMPQEQTTVDEVLNCMSTLTICRGASTDERLLVSSDTEAHGSDIQESDNQVIASSCFSDQREPVLACSVSDDSPCD